MDELLGRRVQIEPPADALDGGNHSSVPIGPLTELSGALRHHAVVVVEGPRLSTLDMVLATAMTFAKEPMTAAALIIDLRDWDIYLPQRLALVASGIAALQAPRPVMSSEAVEVAYRALLPLIKSNLAVGADRHLEVEGLADVILPWVKQFAQSPRPVKTLVVLAGGERMLRTQAQWLRLKQEAMLFHVEILVAYSTEDAESQAYRAAGDCADTWIRLEAEGHGRFKPVLERCSIRPAGVLGGVQWVEGTGTRPRSRPNIRGASTDTYP
jgi:hypothetical protein